MNNEPLDLTFGQYKAFNGGRLPFSLRWQFASSHEVRFQILEELLDQCYQRLTDGRQHNQSHSEDGLTNQVADMMFLAGVPTDHDVQIGGHVDIVVRALDGFLFVAEAKIHNGYAWLKDGFRQLSTRYGLAQEGRDRGELTIYCRNRDARSVLERWKAELLAEFAGVIVREESFSDGRLFFRTKHKCDASGCDFFVRHKIVPMYFRPEK